MDKHNVVRIGDNKEYLERFMDNNNEFLEYEFEYEEREIDYYTTPDGSITYSSISIETDSDGKTKTVANTPHYKWVTKTDFTRNPNVARFTGRVRDAKTYYYGYKIVVNDKGKRKLEKSNLTNNIFEYIDSYPYFKPSWFTQVKYSSPYYINSKSRFK